MTHGAKTLPIFVGVICASLIAVSARTRDTGRAEVARGKYLVEEVAKYAECHTPRDADGNLKPQEWLQGPPFWITPVHSTPNWADQAPPLAGLPQFTNGQMERVLEKGVGPRTNRSALRCTSTT